MEVVQPSFLYIAAIVALISAGNPVFGVKLAASLGMLT
jgi:hypothetical protein